MQQSKTGKTNTCALSIEVIVALALVEPWPYRNPGLIGSLALWNSCHIVVIITSLAPSFIYSFWNMIFSICGHFFYIVVSALKSGLRYLITICNNCKRSILQTYHMEALATWERWPHATYIQVKLQLVFHRCLFGTILNLPWPYGSPGQLGALANWEPWPHAITCFPQMFILNNTKLHGSPGHIWAWDDVSPGHLGALAIWKP